MPLRDSRFFCFFFVFFRGGLIYLVVLPSSCSRANDVYSPSPYYAVYFYSFNATQSTKRWLSRTGELVCGAAGTGRRPSDRRGNRLIARDPHPRGFCVELDTGLRARPSITQSLRVNNSGLFYLLSLLCRSTSPVG